MLDLTRCAWFILHDVSNDLDPLKVQPIHMLASKYCSGTITKHMNKGRHTLDLWVLMIQKEIPSSSTILNANSN